MAIVFKHVKQVHQNGMGQTHWTNIGGVGLANGDQTSGVDLGACLPEKTFQVTGTFGVGGSCQLEASNDGSSWFIVGTAFTAAAVPQTVVSAARFYRFNVTAGDGTTALFATLVTRE